MYSDIRITACCANLFPDRFGDQWKLVINITSDNLAIGWKSHRYRHCTVSSVDTCQTASVLHVHTHVFSIDGHFAFLARDATMSVSVCLSVMEVHWRIIANLGFKFRSKFTVHCGCSACRKERRVDLNNISRYASHC